MVDRPLHKSVMLIKRVAAVYWDGTSESWIAICDMPWDNCYLHVGTFGVVHVERKERKLKPGWVYLDDNGVPRNVSDSDAIKIL